MKSRIILDAPMWNVCDNMGLHPMHESHQFLAMIYDCIICKCDSPKRVPLESIVNTPLEHVVLDSIGENADIILEINKWTTWAVTSSPQHAVAWKLLVNTNHTGGLIRHGTH